MAKRILVVDDEPSIVELLQDILVGEGFVVDAAASAEAALGLIREHIYDCAILDFNLPDMDGVMLHRRIRECDAELADATLFTSGLVQSDANLGYYAAEGAGFLPKPFSVGAVIRAVGALVGRDEEAGKAEA